MLLCRRALLARSLLPRRAGCLSQRRWYTERHSRTVLLYSKPEDVDDLQLLAYTPSSLGRIDKDQNPLFVILSTPSYASRLASTSGPTPLLEKLLSRVFTKSLKHPFGSTILSIRVLTAVVDAFPAPTPGQTAEGFAYTTLLSEDNARHDVVTVPDEGDDHDLGTLEFQFSDYYRRSNRHVASHSRTVPMGSTDYRVAVTLANTLFRTGRKKTMLDVTYRVDPAGDLYAVQHEWLAHCSIPYDAAGERRLINSLDERATSTKKRLNLPLKPLTEPRKISVSLGNILRTVDLPDGSSRPASHELEANLDSYFRATEQHPHARLVWALLMNKSAAEKSEMVLRNAKFLGSLSGEEGERSALEIIWETPDGVSSIDYENSLQEMIYLDGAKLQRVLSGGGGWGDKAGLLALDPTDALQAQDPNEQEISQFTSEDADLTHVQFFTTTNSPPSHLTGLRRGFWSGTIPDGAQKYEAPLGLESKIYTNTFGALSFGGMSIQTKTRLERANVFAADQQTPKETRTKIDVPCATFTYLAPQYSSEHYRSPQIDVSNVLHGSKSVLSDGDKLLRSVTEKIWSVIKEATSDLADKAGVDLFVRRREIRPLMGCLISINPNLISAYQKFDDSVKSRVFSEIRKSHAELEKQLRMSRDLIDRIISQISTTVRESNTDVLTANNFDMLARQKAIIAIHKRLLPTVKAINPNLVPNHVSAMFKTLRVIWGFHLQYIHNQWSEGNGFVKLARRQIDDAKRNLGVPVTQYNSTWGADMQSVANSLQDLLAHPAEHSEQNLSEMKHGGAKQNMKEEEPA